MEYETLEVQTMGAFAEESGIEPETSGSELPVSSSYEYVEGTENSPYIITSSLY